MSDPDLVREMAAVLARFAHDTASRGDYDDDARELIEALSRNGLIIECELCGERLERTGAIIFGPPDAAGYCRKMHVCVERCWTPVITALESIAVAFRG